MADRDDVVYVRDARNWFYRYSHLKTIHVQLGDKVSKGQRIGLVGKEGATAWSHLHFDIKALQPSSPTDKPEVIELWPGTPPDEPRTIGAEYVRWSPALTVSSRPDFAIAAYSGYLKSKDKFELSPDLKVSPTTPPVFLVHGSQDPISPPAHSVVLYLALQEAGVPVELHLYASTTHDFGVRSAARPYTHWTEACLRWLDDQKLVSPLDSLKGTAINRTPTP